jgi:hypothetical protein
LTGFRDVKDRVDHDLWFEEHRDVAAVRLIDGGPRALRTEALQLGLDSPVVLTHDAFTGLAPSFSGSSAPSGRLTALFLVLCTGRSLSQKS